MKTKWVAVLLITVMAALVFASCGKKDDPKALAKRTVELGLKLTSDPSNSESIEKELAEIEAKVKKLSLKDQLSYASEIMTQSSGAIGDALQSATSDLLNSGELKDAANAVGDVLQSSELQGAVDDLKDALNSDELKDALKEADDALKQLENLYNF